MAQIIEIEKYICSTKLEARIREQELMISHNTNLNTCKAFITEDERKKKKQEITKNKTEPTLFMNHQSTW